MLRKKPPEISLKSRSKTLNFEPFFNENVLISLKNRPKTLKKRPFFNVFRAKFNVFTRKFNNFETETLNFEAKFNDGGRVRDKRRGLFPRQPFPFRFLQETGFR